MFDFIADLDAYFCEKYANYDKICILPGYRMPKMQTSEVREDGRTYAYTLPANTMRLALQENKAELLVLLKKRMLDKTFSFSFRPLGIFRRIKNAFSKTAPHKILAQTLARYNASFNEVGEALTVDADIWQGICKGKYVPSKNMIFSLALVVQMTMDDMRNLLYVCGYDLDYAVEKDVVLSYLIEQKIFNRPMIDAALTEYKVDNLYIKEA